MKIAIDIGHANATGASGNGLQEHETSAALARLLSIYLANSHEVDIIDFPNLSNSADLAAAVKEINAGKYDLAVSLHCDHADSPVPRGAHVCYVSERGKAYAVAVASHLCPVMPGRADLIVRRPGLYFLKSTNCPAILVECGFISNPSDAAMLAHEPNRIARAIAAGILEAASLSRP